MKKMGRRINGAGGVGHLGKFSWKRIKMEEEPEGSDPVALWLW